MHIGPQVPRTRRRPRFGPAVIGACAVALLPWIAYLAVTLPTTYQAENWNLTWIGFDLGLVVMLTATAVLGGLRHPWSALVSSATGLLLVCDAWFDWSTSTGVDHTWATLTALAVELPLAAFLIVSAFRGSRTSTALPVGSVPEPELPVSRALVAAV